MNNFNKNDSLRKRDVGDFNHELASKIDHTILKATATVNEITKVCQEAVDYSFKTVCVNSANIPLVSSLLAGWDVLPIAVVGFPLGAMSTKSKVFETKEAIQQGACEIDMVINIGALKSKNIDYVETDIRAVVTAASQTSTPVKVIIETSYLTNEEKILACSLVKKTEAAFVKTSTGFGEGGATLSDIKLMREAVGESISIKASGGIRTREDAIRLIEAGADRVGASASVKIVT